MAVDPHFASWLFADALLLEGKFYTIFSLLFGIGFGLQIRRLQQTGRGERIYLRRLFLLFLFGAFHVTFLWFGDILHLYAAMGVLLYLLRDLDSRRLLMVSAFCLTFPVIGYCLFWALGIEADLGLPGTMAALYEQNTGNDFSLSQIFMSKDWGTLAEFMPFHWLMTIGGRLAGWRYPIVLGVMLLGFVCARDLADGRQIMKPQFLRPTALIAFAIGVPAAVFMAYTGGLHGTSRVHSWDGLFVMAVYVPSSVATGLGYAALFALAWVSRPSLRRLLSVFAAPGRMALTNYLSQTVIGIALFYGIGLAIGGKTGPAVYVLAAFMVFTMQIFWSHLWFKRFEFGPLEWLWRYATYGRVTRSKLASPAKG
jgi:uncharacterized protein